MKIVRTNIFYIIMIWLLVVVLLGSVLYVGYTTNVKDLEQLMVNEAKRLTDIVTVATAVGIDALEDIEYLIAYRLLDNARFIDQLSYSENLSTQKLDLIVNEHDLYSIEILDKYGTILVQSNFSEEETITSRVMDARKIESVLKGESKAELIGFGNNRRENGIRKGVVMARLAGGAIIIKTNMDEMREYSRSFSLGTLGILFNDISKDEGVYYIALQDTLGIVVASPNIFEMTRISRDPFLLEVFDTGWGSRTIRIDSEEILEVASSFAMGDRKYGLLRIGLTTQAIRDIKYSTIRHFIILFVVSLFSGAFMFLYVMIRQNYMLLNKEHDRIMKEVKFMEEETRRSERLASLGHLAAGVAHEIRNPLNSISIIVQQLMDEIKTNGNEEEHHNMLLTIGNEITRISTIIEHFLRYAKPPGLSMTTITLDDLVSKVLDVVGVKAQRNNISIKKYIDHEAECHCDVDQMKQSLVNIILNAIDKIGENGEIIIYAGKHKDMIFFRIKDTGGGIEEEILPKIFDPYFTTKDNGTGLGLSEVHRIITAHDGKIFAENSESQGAVFTINLPIREM